MECDYRVGDLRRRVILQRCQRRNSNLAVLRFSHHAQEHGNAAGLLDLPEHLDQARPTPRIRFFIGRNLQSFGHGVVVAFPQVFRLISIGGALYVGWLGVQALRGAFATAADPHAPAVKMGRSAIVDGFMVQIANPKAVLFFTAVLPPFMDADRPAAPQLALFAVATIGMDFITMSAYGLGGAALARAMTRPAVRRGFDLLIGALLLTAAVLIGLR